MSKNPSRRLLPGICALGVLGALVLTGCGGGSTAPNTAGKASDAGGPMTLWAHQGNAPAEAEPLKTAVNTWNVAHPSSKITIKFIPENSYPTAVAAASATSLPDLLEVNGPTVGSELRAKHLTSLTDLLSPETVNNLTGPIKDQGTAKGQLYAVGQFDSAIGVYGNKKLLDAAHVKYPTSLKDVWTADAFTTAVKTLAAANTVAPGKSLDLKLNYSTGGLTGEFGTYAFSPLVWSAGGDLLRDGKATGAMNSDATARVMNTVASWRPYVTADTDDKDFVSGKVALSWVGHWAFPDYSKALGKDLVALPLPDFGNGAKGGAGSWAWGVTPNSKSPQTAAKFLDLLMGDEYVNAMVAVNGAPPGTKSALAASKQYGKGGPLELWGQLASQAGSTACISGQTLPKICGSIVRPVTAGYPVVTREFANALDAVFKGANAKSTLDKAASTVDVDFADNDGYR